MRTTTAIVSIAAMLALTGCAGEPAQRAESKAFMVYFENRSAELTPEAQSIVAEIASASRQAERSEITIEGTAERTADAATGSESSLTARRTLAVEDALRAGGVAQSVIELHYNGATADTTGVAARGVKITLVAQD